MQIINATDGIRITDTRSTAGLLSQVLWSTTLGFLLTAFGVRVAPETLGGASWFLIVIVNFAMIFAISAAARRSTALGLTLFYIYTFMMGIQVSPIVNSYLHLANGQAIVFNAALTTAIGMAVMAMVAQIARFNYQRFASFAYAGLFALVIIGVVGMFFHFMDPTTYAWLTLVVFSALLLVDFMRLRDTPAGASPVLLALSIYLDALNIFIAWLRIFGGGRNRD